MPLHKEAFLSTIELCFLLTVCTVSVLGAPLVEADGAVARIKVEERRGTTVDATDNVGLWGRLFGYKRVTESDYDDGSHSDSSDSDEMTPAAKKEGSSILNYDGGSDSDSSDSDEKKEGSSLYDDGSALDSDDSDQKTPEARKDGSSDYDDGSASDSGDSDEKTPEAKNEGSSESDDYDGSDEKALDAKRESSSTKEGSSDYDDGSDSDSSDSDEKTPDAKNEGFSYYDDGSDSDSARPEPIIHSVPGGKWRTDVFTERDNTAGLFKNSVPSVSLKPMSMQTVGPETSAEFLTYISEYNYALVANAAMRKLDAFEMGSDGSFSLVASFRFSDDEAPQSVAAGPPHTPAWGFVAVALDNQNRGPSNEFGRIAMFHVDTITDGPLYYVDAKGYLPDHVSFTPDGRKLK